MRRKETEKREAILKESFKLFLSKGYDAVSLTTIERAAKVTRGAVFHHFDNKEDLFKHVADQFIFVFLEDVDYGEEYLSSSKPLKAFMEKGLAIIESRMDYFLQGVDRNISSASFMSFILYLKDHYETWEEKIRIFEEKIRIFEEKTIQTWSDVINLAKARGEIRPDTDTTLLAETFHHLYLGLSFKGAMIDSLSVPLLQKQWEYIYEQQLIK